MRAMVLERIRPAEQSPLGLRDVRIPDPSPGELRVRVHCCGICHTDLHTIEGDLVPHKTPVIPGHQIVGTIEALGAGLRSHKEGDRVGIPWLHSTDGSCHFCTTARENLCDAARFTGYDVDGGYAEYALANGDFAFAIPGEFDHGAAAPLLCAGVIGYRSLRMSGAEKGDCLGLYGFGGSAHLVLQFARYLGCQVYVFTRGAEHRELARELGAAWVGAAEDDPPSKLDAAIIFAPSGSLVSHALRVLAKGATLALAGITMTDIPSISYSLLYHERKIVSVANSTRNDVYECLELANDARVKTEIRSYPLEQANQALADLKHSGIRGAGVLML